jgi:hypothetical protein
LLNKARHWPDTQLRSGPASYWHRLRERVAELSGPDVLVSYPETCEDRDQKYKVRHEEALKRKTARQVETSARIDWDRIRNRGIKQREIRETEG